MLKWEVRNGDLSEEEIANYILIVKKRWGNRISPDLKLIFNVNENNQVDVIFDPPINREVYRSTDYLVNNLEKLNCAKKTEQSDKIIHMDFRKEA
ncbi:MAG: hypothetical protein IJZ64_06580 [Ruminococcus sp.]|nr:hypothetical protein [Ruminococcus sp.]